MPRAKKDVEAGLKRKGFRLDERHHHYFLYWTKDGKKSPIRTKTSHGGGRDLGDTLVRLMAQQCKLTKAEFEQLVDCALSREAYEATLKERGEI
jgi:hypothetical protein